MRSRNPATQSDLSKLSTIPANTDRSAGATPEAPSSTASPTLTLPDSSGFADSAPLPATQSAELRSASRAVDTTRSFEGSGRGPSVETRPEFPEIEGYKILARLGAGGMGDVYRAVDKRLEVEVALKSPRSLAPDARALFLREAQRLAEVQHHNVVAIRNYGESGERVFFTMPLINGPNGAHLAADFRKARGPSLSGRRVLAIAGVSEAGCGPELRRAARGRDAYYRIVATWIAEAAEGLDAAHRLGIFHRDVKPANFLLAPDGRFMVADFGLAKKEDELSASGSLGVTGTYPYVAPERALGDWAKVDHRADIWALGATLYEFLAFQRAYSRSGREVLRDIATKDPIPPRQIVRTTPAALEAICLRAMRRDPADRYSTAREMAEALRSWAGTTRPSQWNRWIGALFAGVGAGTFIAATPAAREWIIARFSQPIPDPAVLTSARVERDEGGLRSPAESDPLPANRSASEVRPAERNAAPEKPSARLTEPDAPVAVAASAPVRRRACIVCVEDLNTADGTSPNCGGKIEAGLVERIRREFGNEMIIARSGATQNCDPETAQSSARQAGAKFLLLADTRCNPIKVEVMADGKVTRVHAAAGPGWFESAVSMTLTGQERYTIRWKVRLDIRLIDVERDRETWSYSEEETVVLDGASEFQGTKHLELLGDAWGRAGLRDVLQSFAADE